MMFARRMWSNDENKVQDAEIQSQLNAIRTQMADNQNSNLLSWMLLRVIILQLTS